MMVFKNRGGFTLIELVMIMVLLGILAAFIIPKYLDLGKDAERAVVDGAAGSLKAAAAVQIAKNRGILPTRTAVTANTDYDTTRIALTFTGTDTVITASYKSPNNIFSVVDLSGLAIP